MSGYCGFSKSNNAIEAEREGKFPLGKAAKLAGVPKELVKKYVRPTEWHHVSKWYNCVDYYDVDEIRGIFGLGLEDDEANPEAVAALANYRPTKENVQVYYPCTVEWLEWGGTRNYPQCTERRETGCKVSVSGATATVTLPDGTVFKKRLATRGFYFRERKMGNQRGGRD